MKKIFSLSILLIYFSVFSYSDEYIDSLKIVLKNDLSDSTRLEILGEISYILMYSDSVQSLEYCKVLEKQIHVSENKYAVANAYRTLGIVYLYYLDYTNAILNFNKALNLYKNIEDEYGRIGYAKTCYNYGLMYEFNADYEVELELYSQAVDIFIENEMYNYLISLYTRYITIYNKIGDFEKEREYNRKVIAIATEIKDDYNLMSVYLSYASLFTDNEQYDSAMYYFEKLKTVSEKNSNYDGLGNYYYNVGYLETQRGNHQKALECHLKAYEIALITENLNDNIDVFYKLGLSYKNLKKYSVARDTLLVGIKMAEKYNFKESNRKMLEILSEVEEATGNYAKALEYRKQYIEIYKQTLNEEKQNHIAYVEAKFEATQKENEIKKLSEDNLIKELKLNKKNTVIIALFIILFILSIASYFIFKHIVTKKRLSEKETELQKQKIKELEKENQLSAMKFALQGEETERHRISKDLHDGLGGLLSGIKLTLSNMSGNHVINNEGVEQFNKAIDLLDESIKELRRVAHNMMPEALVKFGLIEAVSDFCETINQTKKIKTSFQFFGENIRLEQKLEVNIYRIIQELANNALKYSEATDLLIQMVFDNNRISLTVQDNGKGFDTNILKYSKGIGLTNIKSRVELYNGQFELYSSQDEGTEILIEFDLNKLNNE